LWDYIYPDVWKRIQGGFEKYKCDLLPGIKDLPGGVKPVLPKRGMRYRQLRSALGMELDSSVRMYINLVLGFGWDVQSLLLLERWERIPLRESAVIPLLEQKASSLTGLGMALYTQKKLRNRYHFDVILKQLALRIGQEINLRELARLSRCHVNTVKKHLEILESEGVVHRLGGLRRVSNEEIGGRFKVYFWDLGVRNALVGDFSDLLDREDADALWENFFINERIKMFYASPRTRNSVQFYFWRHRKLPANQAHLVEVFDDGRMNAFKIAWVRRRWLSAAVLRWSARPVFTPFFMKHYPKAKRFFGVPRFMAHYLVVPNGDYFTLMKDLEKALVTGKRK